MKNIANSVKLSTKPSLRQSSKRNHAKLHKLLRNSLQPIKQGLVNAEGMKEGCHRGTARMQRGC